MIDAVLFFTKCYTTFFKAPKNKKRILEPGFSHFAALQIANLLCIVLFGYILWASFYTIEWPCFSINDCAVWLLSWNHVSIAILILISASTYRRNRTLRCMEEAVLFAKKCHNIHRKSVLKIVYYFILVIVIFSIKTVTSLQHRDINPAIFLLYSLTYIVPLIMECLLICSCTVVRDTCRKINEILHTLSGKKYNDILLAWNLKKLMKTHQDACNFMRTINTCFDKDLLVDLAFNMVWFVIYIYIITVSLWKIENYNDEFWKVCSVILEVLFLTLRVCFLSYSVNNIETEIQKMLIEIRNLQQSKESHVLCVKMMRQFLIQIADNELKIQVCGCFSVDLSFMRGVISLATTYLVVFIQYGLGEPSSKNSNSTTSS